MWSNNLFGFGIGWHINQSRGIFDYRFWWKICIFLMHSLTLHTKLIKQNIRKTGHFRYAGDAAAVLLHQLSFFLLCDRVPISISAENVLFYFIISVFDDDDCSVFTMRPAYIDSIQHTTPYLYWIRALISTVNTAHIFDLYLIMCCSAHDRPKLMEL